MTPEEHQSEFLYQVEKLGIGTSGRSMTEIARDVVGASVDSLRSLNFGGAPCSSSELIPESDWASMQHARFVKPNTWLQSQILSSSTYDGSISYLVAKGQERTQLGKTFAAICKAGLKNPQHLLDLYQVSERDDDDSSLKKICQIVTDIGFYGAAVSGLLGAQGCSETKSYFVLFDVGNPFPGLLDNGTFATHTWDIISLLGAYDDIVPDECRLGISAWRRSILEYCYTGELCCGPWQQTSQSALLIQQNGVKCLGQEKLVTSTAQRLLQYAEEEGGERGFDLLWENVIRFFLKTGNPRYAHEAAEIVTKYAPE